MSAFWLIKISRSKRYDACSDVKRVDSFEDTHEISFHQIKLGFSKLVLVKKGDQQDECTPIWNIKILEMPLAKNLL